MGVDPVSYGWVIYTFVLGYLIGWSSRHMNKKAKEIHNNAKIVTTLWVILGIITVFILGYSVAGWIK